ncbi:MAG: hypothetical protein ACREX4_19490 [Gammaproteobacteria bacterium]
MNESLLAAITLLIALYGAARTFGWDLVKYFQERGRIRLKVGLREFVRFHPDGKWDTGPNLIQVDAINVGKHRVQITVFGGSGRRPDRTKFDFLIDNTNAVLMPHPANAEPMPKFPWVLDPGDRICFLLPVEAFRPEYTEFHAIDTTDRRWKLDRKSFQKLKREMKELKKPAAE